jgi:hypothetical protein
MTSSKTALPVVRLPAGLTFFLLWSVASAVGMMLFGIPVSLLQWLLGLDQHGDPGYAGDFSMAYLLLGSTLCGAGYGATIGLAQWFVLRRERPRMGGWVPATAAGYACIVIVIFVVAAFQPGWLEWAVTLIVNGKLHWLARVEPAWPAAVEAAGGLALILFGLMLGSAQWLALRGREPRAGWWIAFSAAGWALAVLFDDAAWPGFVLLSWAAPLAVTGAGMAWLLRKEIVAGD